MAKQTVVPNKPKTPKAVVAKGPVNPPTLNGWALPTPSAKDIIIPSIICMQGQSKAVLAGEARFGELRESLGNNLLGSADKAFEMIPVHMTRTWHNMTPVNGVRKFHSIIPVTPENENNSEPYQKDGKEIIPYYTLNFYVLLPDEIKNAKTEEEIKKILPYMISFKSTSGKAGRDLYNQAYVRNLAKGLTPASMVMAVNCGLKENAKGKYQVMNVRAKRESTAQEVNAALIWNQIVRGGAVKVDETAYKQEEQVATPVNTDDDGEY